MSDADRLSKMKQLTSDLKSTASALKSTAAELELIAESMRLSWQERERLRVWAKDSADARLGAAALEDTEALREKKEWQNSYGFWLG